MVRIAGVNLPKEKRIEIGLTHIFGIGSSRSKEILKLTGIDPDTRIQNLTDNEINELKKVIEDNYKVEGDLRREISLNTRRLTEIGCHRGR